jgi:IS5 family transposase
MLDEPVLKDLLAQLVALGRARRVVQGRRLRVDTTVVETDIHYPTDATLLADGVRVLTRGLQRLGQRVRQRARSVARRVFEIAQRSRTAGGRVAPKVREQSKTRMKRLYQGLMGITRAVVRQAEAAAARSRREPLAVQLSITIDLVKRVVAQTRARVLRGDTHFPGKVVSLFEAHTEIIRKGKLAKPTEFGRLVKIQDAEAQFIKITTCVSAGNPNAPCGSPPSIGISRSSIIRRTWPSPMVASPRAATSRPRWPVGSGTSSCRASRARSDGGRRRAALRWRTGSEGRISALKRRHGLRRCRYREPSGMQRWVGLGVIANDLLVLARAGP